MRITLIIMLLLTGLFAPAKACEDVVELDGQWIGFITQVPTTLDSIYEFKAEFKTDGSKISGHTYLAFVNGSGYYGFLRFEGIRQGNRVVIEELEVTEQYMSAFAYWCLKVINLEAMYHDGRMVLTGSWESDNCNGTSGKAYLERMIS